MITVTRYHDISAGHRVCGHEGKCKFLHGHNYRIHFCCQGPIDAIGRIIDFGEIKNTLCLWLEENWDHKFLLWDADPLVLKMKILSPESLVVVPFNPTAENMAIYLVETVGPALLLGSAVSLVRVVVEETRKCQACYTR